MNGTDIGLDELGAAYRRISRSLYRALEDAYDFVAEAIVEALERDQTVVDAAFFVLIFGQLENRINLLTIVRPEPGSKRAGRQAGFRRRLAIALPGRDKRLRRREIEQWYELRNRAAHGEAITGSYDVPAILARARDLGARSGPA